MLEKSGSERIVIFIDGNNLYHIVKRMFPNKRQIDFNFKKFIDFLAANRTCIGVYYYTAPLDKSYDEAGYMKQQKFFDLLQRIPNFKLVLCRMQKVIVEGKKIYQVKEDDIHLAVDMVKLAYNDKYDTAVLVSSDGDFAPAVLSVKEIDKKVENIGFENIFSYHLKQKCDRFRKLRKDGVEQFFSHSKD
jgi:uncharacterized LabA/DUF88 family protein